MSVYDGERDRIWTNKQPDETRNAAYTIVHPRAI